MEIHINIKGIAYCVLLIFIICIVDSDYQSTEKSKSLEKEINYLKLSIDLCSQRKIPGVSTDVYPIHNLTYTKYKF